MIVEESITNYYHSVLSPAYHKMAGDNSFYSVPSYIFVNLCAKMV